MGGVWWVCLGCGGWVVVGVWWVGCGWGVCGGLCGLGGVVVGGWWWGCGGGGVVGCGWGGGGVGLGGWGGGCLYVWFVLEVWGGLSVVSVLSSLAADPGLAGSCEDAPRWSCGARGGTFRGGPIPRYA